MKRNSFNIRSGSKGQSFVELSLIVLLLMLLLAGVAEFGVLLNRYLNILDGAREAARYGANYDPFGSPCSGTVDADGICSEFYAGVATEANNVILPLKLDTALHDDIVISIFVLANNNFCRYPSGSENGWSWSEKIKGLATPNHTSARDSAFIQSQLDPTAP